MPSRRTNKKDSREFTIVGTKFTITDNKDGIIEMESASDRQRHAVRWLLGEMLRRDGAQFKMSQSNTRFYYDDQKVGEIADGRHKLTPSELFAKAEELSERIPALEQLDGFLVEENVTLPAPIPPEHKPVERTPVNPDGAFRQEPVATRIIRTQGSGNAELRAAKEATESMHAAAIDYLQRNHVTLHGSLRDGLHDAMAKAHMQQGRGRK